MEAWAECTEAASLQPQGGGMGTGSPGRPGRGDGTAQVTSSVLCIYSA